MLVGRGVCIFVGVDVGVEVCIAVGMVAGMDVVVSTVEVAQAAKNGMISKVK